MTKIRLLDWETGRKYDSNYDSFSDLLRRQESRLVDILYHCDDVLIVKLKLVGANTVTCYIKTKPRISELKGDNHGKDLHDTKDGNQEGTVVDAEIIGDMQLALPFDSTKAG